MKRKHALMDNSDDEVAVITRDKPKKKRQESRLKLLIYVNIVIFTILILPFIAVNYIPDQPFSHTLSKIWGEHCSSQYWTTQNLTMLKQSLDEHLFGQHIAKALIMSALSRRWTHSHKYSKPLVMSFHGWTGSGKNFVAKFIAEALFRKGMKSRHSRMFISTVHFYDERFVSEYERNLRDWILSNVTACPHSLFIFDEVDKMPVGVLDSVKPFMDHHAIINGVDLSKSMFLLLSNTGGREITRKTFESWKSGFKRSELRYVDYEGLIMRGAFNEVGGLQNSAIIDKSLIDVYVPFLPLEPVHVRQCVEKELIARGLSPVDHVGLIQSVLAELTFWPEDSNIFSTTGCKRVAQKVDELLYDEGL